MRRARLTEVKWFTFLAKILDSQSRPFGAPPVNVWVTLDRGHRADTPALLGSATSGLMHRSKGIFDHRVGTGGQPCFTEILGNAPVSTQCWTNAATNFEAALHEGRRTP